MLRGVTVRLSSIEPRRWRRVALPGLLAASLAAMPLALAPLPVAAQTVASPHDLAALPSLAPLVKKVMAAVVNVSAEENGQSADQDSDNSDNGSGSGDNDQEQGQSQNHGQGQQFGQNSPFDELLRKFFEQQMPGLGNPLPHNMERVALGSGFIIDPQGYIVTNNHVVQGADKVTVIFQDDSRHPAQVIGRDTKTDLALLKIKTDKPLPYVNWGDSNAAQVGDWVLAVGNPFGLGGTVSSGIISARGRDIHSGPYDDFLQLDAAINRGNSGGPTFNLAGQVIGINTAIYSPNGGSVGIGFAIPSSLARPVIDQLKEHHKVLRGWLGVQIQEVTPEIAKSLGLPKAEGALVADVTVDGPAQKAGFKQGDVILSFDGHSIRHVRDLPIIVAETRVNEKADVKIWRKDGPMTLNPTIAEMPNNPKLAAAATPVEPPKEAQHAAALGVKLAALDQDWRSRLHTGKNVKGVVVTSVAADSPFAREGLQPGDVIQTIDQEPVGTPREAAKKLEAAKQGKSKSVLLLINRNGSNAYVAVSMDKNADNG
jgi:serine protease Do